MNYRPDLIPTSGKNMNRNFIDEHYDFDILSRSHEAVLQELSNRQASLDLLRNSTRYEFLTVYLISFLFD